MWSPQKDDIKNKWASFDNYYITIFPVHFAALVIKKTKEKVSLPEITY